MSEDKQMLGDSNYEIKTELRVGNRNVVFAENMKNPDGEFYFVGIIDSNDLFSRYEGCVGGNYLEAMQEFTKKLQFQIDECNEELAKITVPLDIFTVDQCYPNDYGECIENKVVVVKSDEIRRDIRNGATQLIYVTGGNGAAANARGSAVFNVNIYSGKHSRWERRDILGVLKPECMPDWAKERLLAIQAERQMANKKPKSREER